LPGGTPQAPGHFGLKTFWVNRLDATVEELGAKPDAAGRTPIELANYVTA
jgi:hypothetical protein